MRGVRKWLAAMPPAPKKLPLSLRQRPGVVINDLCGAGGWVRNYLHHLSARKCGDAK